MLTCMPAAGPHGIVTADLLEQYNNQMAQALVVGGHGTAQVHAKYLVANISAMHGKVKLVESQFQKETYTKKSLPALSTIRKILQEAEEAGQREIEQVHVDIDLTD
eukprot:jgi/Chrzof1/11283/Cz05g31010.t1